MKPRLISLPDPVSSQLLDGAGGRVVYWCFSETAGAAAQFRLWDSSTNADTLMASVQLPSDTSSVVFPGFHSLPYKTGLFLEVVSGSIEGAISVIPFDDWGDDNYSTPVTVIGSVEIDVNATNV